MGGRNISRRGFLMGLSWQVAFYRNGFLHIRGRTDIPVDGVPPSSPGLGLAPLGTSPLGL